jgi:diaminopimelate decarboxylase
MKIYLSGVHSGPNPSPGLGSARSLRVAYPDAQLVAVDYSTRSSGLHSPEFDRFWIQRPWEELDLDLHAAQVRNVLDTGSYWISGLDLEAKWLAEVIGPHRQLLVPPPKAFRLVAKPRIDAHGTLGMHVPPSTAASLPDWDLHAFCREYGWNAWLKGPYYEARRIKSWVEFEVARSELGAVWPADALFLQAHVPGHEESIAFSAYHGKMLDCAYMSKRDVTSEGKTWAGRVTDVPESIVDPLREVIGKLEWTGGAEIEFIRDCDDKLWVIDWNPRFPAWIHGSTIAGHNLLGRLLEAATGCRQADSTTPASEDFTRVIIEIPCRPDLPLAPLPELPTFADAAVSKHPSGMPRLAQRLSAAEPSASSLSPVVPAGIVDELESQDVARLATPIRLRLEGVAVSRFAEFANTVANISSQQVAVHIAYSIKTDPARWLLRIALRMGMLAEATSQGEIQHALECGFSPDNIILNSPAKWWPSRSQSVDSFRTVFADSLEELRSYRGLNLDRVGIRLRLPSSGSRFGVAIDSYGSFQSLIEVLDQFADSTAIGLHFHLSSGVMGLGRWWHAYDSFLVWARAIENSTRRPVDCVDIGGGWFPDDADRALRPGLTEAVTRAREALPKLREFFLEPGKALTQSTMALATRVLEVRFPDQNQREVVVDAAIADLPMASAFPHRVLAQYADHKWRSLPRGDDRIFGRSCMEDDILSEKIRLPYATQPGDTLVICDAGAYDRSMAYEFAKG